MDTDASPTRRIIATATATVCGVTVLVFVLAVALLLYDARAGAARYALSGWETAELSAIAILGSAAGLLAGAGLTTMTARRLRGSLKVSLALVGAYALVCLVVLSALISFSNCCAFNNSYPYTTTGNDCGC